MDITRVPQLSDEEKSELKQLTAHALPDAPSARGYSAAQIKAALVRAFVGEDEHNVAALIDRVIEDMNTSLGEIEGELELLPRMRALVDGFERATATAQYVETDQPPAMHLHNSADENGGRTVRFELSFPRSELFL